jgi:hypothetical protein
MSSSSLPLSSSSDAILQPGLDPKQAVRPGHVASLGQSRSDRLEREPFGLAFPCVSLARTAIHLPLLRSHIASKLPPASSTSAPPRRRIIWRSFAYYYLHREFHACTHGRNSTICFLNFAHPSRGLHASHGPGLCLDPRTRQSRISALSHSSFTYNYIISYLPLTDLLISCIAIAVDFESLCWQCKL